MVSCLLFVPNHYGKLQDGGYFVYKTVKKTTCINLFSDKNLVTLEKPKQKKTLEKPKLNKNLATLGKTKQKTSNVLLLFG